MHRTRFVVALVVVAAAVSAAFGAAVSTILTADRLIITDAAERTRITLMVDPVTGPSILMYDEAGAVVRRITADAATDIDRSNSAPLDRRWDMYGEIVAIRHVNPDPEVRARAGELRREARRLADQADVKEREAAAVRRLESDDAVTRNAHQREAIALDAEAASLRADAAARQDEAKAIVDLESGPHQRIEVVTRHGRAIVRTRRDLSADLAGAFAGRWIGWNGRPVAVDGDTTTYEATRVGLIESSDAPQDR